MGGKGYAWILGESSVEGYAEVPDEASELVKTGPIGIS